MSVLLSNVSINQENTKLSVVKAHVLLILDLDELGGSGVRDFGLP